MNVGTTFLRRCIASLGRAMEKIKRHEGDDNIMYEFYRTACVKKLEPVLEQSGEPMLQSLAARFASNKRADHLHSKDIFRHAARHDLIAPDATGRWQRYRDNRNFAAHDYGEIFAKHALELPPAFIADAKPVACTLDRMNDE